MFVRIKKIKGKTYAYLVENEWTPWGSRQKVVKYLGRSFDLERVKENEAKLSGEFSDMIRQAIVQELTNHGFFEHDGKYMKGQLVVNLDKKTVKHNKKDVALAMNEGFLCEHTFKELADFKPLERQDESAAKLANLALEAGLKLSQEQFVQLFETIQKALKQEE